MTNLHRAAIVAAALSFSSAFVWAQKEVLPADDLVKSYKAPEMASDFDKRFPNIRWGFLEGGASWLPTVTTMDARLRASAEEFLSLRPITPETIEEKQVFVSIESDDPIDYLTGVVGENMLVGGTDYAHNDRGTELGSHTFISQRQDIKAGLAPKIVDSNGRRLLGVKEDFRPAPPANLGPMKHVKGASTANGDPILVHTLVTV